MFRLRPIHTVLLLLAVFAIAACDSSPTAPTMNSVAGDYRATEFTVTTSGQTVNLLANGALLEMTLRQDGTTTGRLFVPGGEEDGSDFDASLDGTWTLRGDTVRFAQAADTFVRDVPFRVNGDRLQGQFSAGSEGSVRVVLAKR